jgi:hypothetical protein
MMWKPVRNGDAYKYTPKHVFATKNHSLSGATLMQVIRGRVAGAARLLAYCFLIAAQRQCLNRTSLFAYATASFAALYDSLP